MFTERKGQKFQVKFTLRFSFLKTSVIYGVFSKLAKNDY